jgi:hypothetical protein
VNIAPVAHSRHLRGAPATLNVTLYDENGEPADAAGTVTVGITKADGTDLLAAGSSTTNPSGTGSYARALTAAQTATLELLTATWTDGGDASTHTSAHELVGAYYFSLTEARQSDTAQLRQERYDDTQLIEARRAVEGEFEMICGVAFVPRYARVRLDGTGCDTIKVPDALVRTVRSVRTYSSGSSYTTFTAGQLAAIRVGETGRRSRLVRSDGGTFDAGCQNIVIEYEHGHDRPPAEIKQAALRRLRQTLGLAKSAIPFNAISFTPETGVTYRLSTPSIERTGDADIDSILARWSLRV